MRMSLRFRKALINIRGAAGACIALARATAGSTFGDAGRLDAAPPDAPRVGHERHSGGGWRHYGRLLTKKFQIFRSELSEVFDVPDCAL